MYGVAFGLVVGEDDGDNVKNIKFELLSTYLYRIDFCWVLTWFVTTGSQKKFDVTILKKFGTLVPSLFKYSILNPTKPWAINLFLNCAGTLSKLITIPLM